MYYNPSLFALLYQCLLVIIGDTAADKSFNILINKNYVNNFKTRLIQYHSHYPISIAIVLEAIKDHFSQFMPLYSYLPPVIWYWYEYMLYKVGLDYNILFDFYTLYPYVFRV